MTVPEEVTVPTGAVRLEQGDTDQAGRSLSFSAIVSDAGALYGLQVAKYALPIVTLAYLARVLGPGGLGLVAYSQSIGGYINILVEYGFHLTLTREVARNRESASKLSELLAAVCGAKFALALLAIPLLVGFTVFGKGYDARLAGWTFAWSVSQSFNLVWYLHGTEQLKLASILDAGGKIFATIGIFLTVKGPEQIVYVFIWQTVGALLGIVVSARVAYKGNKFILPSWSMTRNALRLGWPIFVQNSCSQIYPSGNVVILGIVSSNAVVGLFSGPDRIIRGAVSLLVPLLYSAYPRVSRVAHTSPSRGASLAAVTIWASTGVGTIASVALYWFAPSIVRIALGPGFSAAVGITRILALIPFLRSITSAIALEWMMPFGFERSLAAVYAVTSGAGIVIATLAAMRWGVFGAAWVTVFIEAIVAAAQLGALSRGTFNPATALLNRETRHLAAAGVRSLLFRSR